MNHITLTVDKAKVYDEVAKTTGYAGAKMTGDDDAYDRIFTTEKDRSMLDRFWAEACNGATNEFKPYLEKVTASSGTDDASNNYVVDLELSSAFDTTLKASMESSLFSYFVATIVGKWCKFTDKDEAGSYAADAEATMLDVRRKMYYRKSPTRRAIK